MIIQLSYFCFCKTFLILNRSLLRFQFLVDFLLSLDDIDYRHECRNSNRVVFHSNINMIDNRMSFDISKNLHCSFVKIYRLLKILWTRILLLLYHQFWFSCFCSSFRNFSLLRRRRLQFRLCVNLKSILIRWQFYVFSRMKMTIMFNNKQ